MIHYVCATAHTLTLRCKAIRGRFFEVGAAWLGLGGVWLLDGVRHSTPPNHTQPNQKPIRAPASPGTKQWAMRRMVTHS